MPVDVGALDHVGVGVTDLEAAVALLVELFGAVVVRRGDPAPGTDLVAQFAVPPGSGYRLALLRIGGADLELFEWAAPGRRDAAPGLADAGAVHLALAVPDVDAAVAGLAGDGRVRVLGEVQQLAPPHPRAGRRWIYLATTCGFALELVADPAR